MIKYIGITIGPIIETLNEASSPAQLWFASTMFSDLTRRLCKTILENFKTVKIISPYYVETIPDDDGIGKFHDRIIFTIDQAEESNDKLKDTLDRIIEAEKESTLNHFPISLRTQDKGFINQFLQVRFIIKDFEDGEKSSHCIEKINDYLNAIEYIQTFPKDTENNILRKMFANKSSQDQGSRNTYIHQSNLLNKIALQYKKNFIIDDHFKSVSEIAGCENPNDTLYKRDSYFAVVQADGDHISEVLKQKKTENDILDFSMKCFEYAMEAATLVSDFGGMTIYAGGDDLLFLAPIINQNGKLVFELCQEIQNKFYSKIQGTLSFGISIQYHKFPLYEALNSARHLLFDVCKENDYTRNSLALYIQKHSGKAYKILIPSNKLEVFINLLDLKSSDDENGISGLIRSLRIHKKLISLLDKKVIEEDISLENYKDIWCNFYDNPGQQSYKDLQEKIASIHFIELKDQSHKKISIINHKDEENDAIDSLISILRIKSFLLERKN